MLIQLAWGRAFPTRLARNLSLQFVSNLFPMHRMREGLLCEGNGHREPGAELLRTGNPTPYGGFGLGESGGAGDAQLPRCLLQRKRESHVVVSCGWVATTWRVGRGGGRGGEVTLLRWLGMMSGEGKGCATATRTIVACLYNVRVSTQVLKSARRR